MFQFIGYNLFGDFDCLNNAPSNVDNITTTRISNAIFDHLNITKDTDQEFNTTIPVWDYDTVLDADFNGNINGGNLDYLVGEITAIEVKRRIKGTFDWITLKTYPVDDIESFTFIFNDRIAASGTEYDYAFVPIMEDVEGEYIINSIETKFNGVFIGDLDTIYKFLYDFNYSNNIRNQQIGTFEPLGRKYPVIVANGQMSYDSGTVSGTVINDDFEINSVLDPPEIVKKMKNLLDFLTNKKAKVLKDLHGNIWLCVIKSAPRTDYKTGTGVAIPTVTFDWVEIGDPNNQQDLWNTGLVEEVT